VTKDVSAESASATDVIPLVIGIKRARSQLTNETGLQTMKKEIINDMNTRFADVAWQTFQSVVVRNCQAVASGRSSRCALPDPVTEGAATASDYNHGASELK